VGRGAAGQWQWEDDEFQFLAQLDGGCLKVGNDKIATLLHAHLTECECVRAPACVCVCVCEPGLWTPCRKSKWRDGAQKWQSAVKRRKIDANFYA